MCRVVWVVHVPIRGFADMYLGYVVLEIYLKIGL